MHPTSASPTVGFTYPGTQHGSDNATIPRHDEAATDLAWKRTMEFFQQNLRG